MRLRLGLLLAVAALVGLPSAPAAAAEAEGKTIELRKDEIPHILRNLPNSKSGRAVRDKLTKDADSYKFTAEEVILIRNTLPDDAPKAVHEKFAEEKHERSMFERALDLGIWTLLVFLILFFVLYKFAWGPMLQGLDKREKEIAAAVEESHKARAEALQLQQELQKVRQQGYEEIRTLIDEARRDADKVKEQRKAEAEVEITAERDRLRREINLAKDQALKEIWSQAAELASLISAKAVRRQLNDADHRGLVDEALADMRRAAEESRQALSGTHA